MTGPGAVVGGDDEMPDVDAVAAKMKQISSLKNAKEYFQLNDQVGDVFTALTSPPQEGSADGGGEAEAASGFDSVAAVFDAMPDAFDAGAAGGVDVVFQYIISGSGGGDWSCAIKDSKCTVESGKHDKPTCTLKMEAGDFLDMMGGKLPPMQAFSSGKLVIEGDVMKSQLIEKLFKM